MCTRKSTAARILFVGCAVGICFGGTYTWNGGGADDDWDNADNWSCIACTGYPDGTDDDAVIDGTYDVDLVDECIDDLTVTGTVDFAYVTSGSTVHVDTFTIAGPATVTMATHARITTEACP